uniref:Uncharacterized protein n=1 Tax=Arundo donax TaxID=35708 RepID=A0A0A9AYW3_ARUDO
MTPDRHLGHCRHLGIDSQVIVVLGLDPCRNPHLPPPHRGLNPWPWLPSGPCSAFQIQATEMGSRQLAFERVFSFLPISCPHLTVHPSI